MFAWAEPGLRIDDPVRSLLRSAALVAPHDCASTRVFAIRHEMRIGNAYSTKVDFRGRGSKRSMSRERRAVGGLCAFLLPTEGAARQGEGCLLPSGARVPVV